MNLCFASNVPVPTGVPSNTDVIGGWTGDQLDKFSGWTDTQIQKLGDTITKAIYNGFISIMDTIFDFVFWASEVGIICCIIVYIASKDNKAISLGWKLALAYVVSAVVMNNL